MHTLHNKPAPMTMNDVVKLIDDILALIPSSPFVSKGINCLLPCNCSQDVQRVSGPLLMDLKSQLQKSELNSFAIGQLITEKFESSLSLEIYFPDMILGKLLNLFYSLLFVDASGNAQQALSYNVRKSIAQLLVVLLKKSKKIDKTLFKADWRKIYLLIDDFIYPKNETCSGYHHYQTITYDIFIDLAKNIRRFYQSTAIDEVLNEFEDRLDPFYSKEALRAVRYIALFLPFENLNSKQIERVLNQVVIKVASFKRVSTQFDVFIAFIVKKITKGNRDLLKGFDWGPLSDIVFEQILPVSLKIPSPLKGANRKVGKLLSKVDVELGEDVFDTLGKDVNARVSKWIVYTMQCDSYEASIHGKLLFFLDSLRNLCHPANFGPWCIQIELFLGYIAGLISKQLNIDPEWLVSIPPRHIDEIVSKIWDLSELLVFARSGPALSGMCVSSFTCTYLANIRPDFIIPKAILAISNALNSVSEPHRTTSALGLLHITMPNLMNTRRSFSGIAPVLSLLPTAVYGIDANDQLKSIRTLSLFLSFSESACIEDISGIPFDFQKWSEYHQEAKELTVQFPEVFLQFTENVISYLKSVSTQNPNENDDIARMILAIGNCIYSRVSGEIASICLEKWMELLEDDLSSRIIEIVGEIVANFGKRHQQSLFDKTIPKLILKIEVQVFERGEGQIGSKDQSNNSLNNNLIFLSNLLENAKSYVEINSKDLFQFALKLLTGITNRKTFCICSRIFYSITSNLTRWEIREILPVMHVNENPFLNWGHWVEVEDLEEEKDYKWICPSESNGFLALSLLESVIEWTTKQLSSCSLLSQTKKESELLVCVLESIDNTNIALLSLYNSFASYNYQINSELHVPGIVKKVIELLRINLTNLKGLSDFSGNLEIELRIIEIVGSILKGSPVHPDRPREKLKSLKRLNINYDRFLRDKYRRPTSFWILKAEAQFKLRRDLRYDLGDEFFEVELLDLFNDLSECILYKSSFKKYHMIRASSQHHLRSFTHKYGDVLSIAYISKTLELVEKSDDLSESEFKGVCFLLKNHYVDVISDHFELLERVVRSLMKLSSMPIAAEISDSFDILNSLLNELSNSFVPELGKSCSSLSVKKLILDCFSFARDSEDNWTRQYLALLSAHPLLELVSCPEIFPILASLTLSKVSTIRNLAQNCFRMALFSYVRSIDPGYFKYRDFGTFDISKTGKFIEKPELMSNSEQFKSFEEFETFFREYLKYLFLNEGDESGSSLKFEYGNFLNIGRLIVLNLGTNSAKFIEFLSGIFKENQMKDLGKQRALVEIISALICNINLEKLDEGTQKGISLMLQVSWTNLAIENLELWSSAIDEPLMMNQMLMKEVFKLVKEEKSTTCTILGLKLLFSIYNQIGKIAFNDQPEEQLLLKNLIKFQVDSSTNSQIISESSKLMSMIFLKLPALRVQIIEHFHAVNEEEQFLRAKMNFLAYLSTIPNLTEYWSLLADQLDGLLAILRSGEKVQLLTDAKRALLTLFLAKGATLQDLNIISEHVMRFLKEANSSTILASKMTKFCVELVQVMLQSNFFLFHRSGSAKEFFSMHIDPLIESEQLDLRESSHGLALTIHQIDPKTSAEAISAVISGLTKMRLQIKSSQMVKERHSLVVRASALILAEPHVISERLPFLLTILSFYISDRSPISPLVRTTFSEFRRTHQDNWDTDRQLFNEDQLDAIGELLIAPSYYA